MAHQLFDIYSKASPLRGKNILLGVTGSIAAYKAADRPETAQSGAEVDVILTQSACQFIQPLTFNPSPVAGLTWMPTCGVLRSRPALVWLRKPTCW
jgi:hypothetical protein